MGCCLAPCTLKGLDSYAEIIKEMRSCLDGNVRPVREACAATISALSGQYRYEEASEVLQRLRIFEFGMRRKARLDSLVSCPQIIAARRLGEIWEIHIIRYAQLCAAAIALPGDDPIRVAETAIASAKAASQTELGTSKVWIEEAELIATWLEQPGIRLIDIDGTWGWSIHAQ